MEAKERLVVTATLCCLMAVIGSSIEPPPPITEKTSFFKEILSPDGPLYNFYNFYNQVPIWNDLVTILQGMGYRVGTSIQLN